MKQKDLYKIAAFASAFNNDAHIILPKSWVGLRVIAMLKQQYDIEKNVVKHKAKKEIK
ncbi:MAG: hypothetical protein WAM14_03450 [Candidatus Nitrosopolaris sp.]